VVAGHCGFAVKYYNIVFYVDPHAHPSHMDPQCADADVESVTRAKVVLPKSTTEHACSIGIPLDRMTAFSATC
jgi:L-ascorbate metabolism protein UlaG (beta-lactamase superfamily)